jgi:hypothetical protein
VEVSRKGVHELDEEWLFLIIPGILCIYWRSNRMLIYSRWGV